MPKLIKESELSKYTDSYLGKLKEEKDLDSISQLTGDLLYSIKTLYDRINQDSSNSSLPPSSNTFDKHRKSEKSNDTDNTSDSGRRNANTQVKPLIVKDDSPKKQHNKADVRKNRSQGYGRTQKLPVSEVIDLKLKQCQCGHTLSDTCNSKAYTGFYQLDLEKSSGFNDYRIKQTKFLLYETECDDCHALNRYVFQHQKTSITGLEITGYGLVGATLAGMIVYLNKSLNLPCSKVRELLHETYGIKLSKGLINQTVHEAGLCCEPLAEEIKEEVLNSALCHVDETGWKNFHQEKKNSWLWVFKSPTACYFAVGSRTKAFFKNEFAEDYDGWLMSDGYSAYRHYDKRFRCLSHLKRKAVGLSESHHDESRLFGQAVLNLFEKLFKGVYEARSGNKVNQSIKANYEADLLLFKRTCQAGLDSPVEGIRKLSYEFLHDWDAIFRVLDHPEFPLTNNEAERALRHWVINRKVSLGSQSDLGAKTLGILASIIQTCKCKKSSAINAISNAVHNYRFGYASATI